MNTDKSSTHQHFVQSKPTTNTGVHSHSLSAVDAALAALGAKIGDLAVRVAALEEPPVDPPPPPPPPPPPVEPPPVGSGTLQERIDAAPAGSTLDLHGLTFTAGATVKKALRLFGGTLNITTLGTALTVTANDVTVEGMTITGPGSVGNVVSNSIGIATSSTALSGLRIIGNTVKGFRHYGLYIENAAAPVISGNTVTDCSYTGIGLLSVTGGSVTGNTVQRIGYTGHDAADHNAYGIICSYAGGPITTGVLVDNNLVEDVPLWHGLDTHGGSHITWSNNTIRRCPRAIFLPGGTDQTVKDNHIGPPNAQMAWTCEHGKKATDNIALTLYKSGNVAITGNTAEGFPTNWYDFQGQSTNVTLSGNAPDNTLVKP